MMSDASDSDSELAAAFGRGCGFSPKSPLSPKNTSNLLNPIPASPRRPALKLFLDSPKENVGGALSSPFQSSPLKQEDKSPFSSPAHSKNEALGSFMDEDDGMLPFMPDIDLDMEVEGVNAPTQTSEKVKSLIKNGVKGLQLKFPSEKEPSRRQKLLQAKYEARQLDIQQEQAEAGRPKKPHKRLLAHPYL